MNTLAISNEQIPMKIYQNMRITCGLSPKTDKAAQLGLDNSLFSVMIKKEETIIGMGRIIGDGGCFCQVVDICVLPKNQGQGIAPQFSKNPPASHHSGSVQNLCAGPDE